MSRDLSQVTQGWTGARPPISIVILTLDEEINIAACLASCSWTDDVHVLDSGSTDRTVEVAESLGARVHFNRFTSFGAQRNWAIESIPLRYPWVFHLDADECFTPAMISELDRLMQRNPAEAGFHVPSKLIFLDRWLRRSGGYPVYQMRLFHKERMRFCDHGHGQREECDGEIGRLAEPYLHYAFSKGLPDWLDKHNRYSTLEAEQILVARGTETTLSGVFSRDPVVRRRTLKAFTNSVPCRASLRWFYTMFVLGGVLDGPPGWTYARMLALYESMIALKLRVHKVQSPSGEGDTGA